MRNKLAPYVTVSQVRKILGWDTGAKPDEILIRVDDSRSQVQTLRAGSMKSKMLKSTWIMSGV